MFSECISRDRLILEMYSCIIRRFYMDLSGDIFVSIVATRARITFRSSATLSGWHF